MKMLTLHFFLVLLAVGTSPGQEDLPWTTHRDPRVREQGLRELKRKEGDLPKARIERLLGDPDWGVVLQAVDTFADRREPFVRERLVDLVLQADLLRIRRAAATALSSLNAELAAKEVMKRMNRLGEKGVLRGIDGLGYIGSAVAVASLSRLARSSDGDVCLAAAAALGQLRAGKKALIRGMRDSRDAVAIASAVALASSDDDDVRAALVGFCLRRDEPWALRRIGQRAAEANREAWTIAVLTALENTKRPYGLLRVAWEGRLEGCARVARHHLDSLDPVVCSYAFIVGGLSREPFGEKLLARGFRHRDERVRRAAARAAVEQAVRAGTFPDMLQSLLKEEDSEVAMVAVRTAWDRRTEEALPGLLALAAGKHGAKKSWEVRCAASVCAGRVGKLTAVGTLLGLAQHRDWKVRGAALEGLAQTYRREAMGGLLDAYNDRHQVPRRVARRNLHWLSGGRTYPDRAGWKLWWSRVGKEFVLRAPDMVQPDEPKQVGYQRRMPPDYVRQALTGTDITVVIGNWDKVQFVLGDLGVAHDLRRGQEVKEEGVWPKQTVCINCEGSLDKTTNEFLRWMVVCGGYMATSDWALTNTIYKTFPGIIKGHVRQSTGNNVVRITPCAPGHFTLRDVVPPHVDMKWWLEIQAFPISIHDPVSTTVLVDSFEMGQQYGRETMMATFRAGLGQVLHTTSHFYLQQEGFANAGSGKERQRYAVDHLGIPVDTVRDLVAFGGLGDARHQRVISQGYSMFKMLVNFIREKKKRDR